jgi:hypothetical protein
VRGLLTLSDLDVLTVWMTASLRLGSGRGYISAVHYICICAHANPLIMKTYMLRKMGV